MEIKVPPIDSMKLYRKVAYNDDNGTIITEVMPVVCLENGLIVGDPIRQPRYEGLCFINGQPITFKIENAATLAQACTQFPLAVQKVADEWESAQTRARILAANQRPPRAPR